MPAGVVDPVPGNNTAIDTDTLTPQAELAVSKTDGQDEAIPGTATTYTITVSNAGPSDAPAAQVLDTLPASLSDATWSCVAAGGATCTASGRNYSA